MGLKAVLVHCSTRALVGIMLAGWVLCMAALASAKCRDQLSSLRATVTFQTRTYRGRPIRRDGMVDVTLRSTSTTAISAAELAIFLGASLQSVDQTRPAALPTRKYRSLPDGGLAYRTEVTQFWAPGATHSVRLHAEALPLDRQLDTVRIVVVSCKHAVPVGLARLSEKPGEEDTTWQSLGLLALALALGTGLLVILRALR